MSGKKEYMGADCLMKNHVWQFIRQLISYGFVGGIAALVEWLFFTLLTNLLGINYLLATSISFVFSTTTNWLLGKKITFRESDAYKGKTEKEIFLVFLVSGIGLLFNLGIMYILVDVLMLNTALLLVVSKIFATGIVFVWNFLIRKYFIYK